MAGPLGRESSRGDPLTRLPGSPSLNGTFWPRVARAYGWWRVSRGLDGLHVAGLDAFVREVEAGPRLVVANHVAWWDGVVASALGHALGLEVRLVARADTLVHNPWMRQAGVIPLPGGAALRGCVREVAEFLDRPRRVVWFFPQGRQRPDSVRPLGFQSGVRLFAGIAPALPVALAYPFREVDVPAAMLDVGAPLTDGFEADVTARLDRISAFVEGDPRFVEVVASRRRPQQRGLAARLLGAAR